MYVPVLSSSVPGENTMKKFGRNESHCTSRKLATRARRRSRRRRRRSARRRSSGRATVASSISTETRGPPPSSVAPPLRRRRACCRSACVCAQVRFASRSRKSRPRSFADLQLRDRRAVDLREPRANHRHELRRAPRRCCAKNSRIAVGLIGADVDHEVSSAHSPAGSRAIPASGRCARRPAAAAPSARDRTRRSE